jgi:2-polyprenyl-3-methyl-5-hydroxy-6-metoxy-1,4-benzoquinol methylase
MSAWYERAFDESYLECYEQFEQEPVWLMDCAFLEKQLELEAGEAVLDLCCGAGRHSLELARRGYRLTGLDVSPTMIEVAKSRSAEQGAEVNWIRQDAKEMDFTEEFDAVFNYLTSFGHCDHAGNTRIIANVFRSLRPGGRFLLEMINMIWLLSNFVPTERRVYEGFTYVERRRYDWRTGRITTRREKAVAGESPQILEPFDVQAYLPFEVIRMLEEAGFEAIDAVASPSGQALQAFSTPRMAFVARRPA